MSRDLTGLPDEAWWAVRDAVVAAVGCEGQDVARIAADAVEQMVAGLIAERTDRRPNFAWAIERLGPHELPPAVLAAAMRRVADELEERASERCCRVPAVPVMDMDRD